MFPWFKKIKETTVIAHAPGNSERISHAGLEWLLVKLQPMGRRYPPKSKARSTRRAEWRQLREGFPAILRRVPALAPSTLSLLRSNKAGVHVTLHLPLHSGGCLACIMGRNGRHADEGHPPSAGLDKTYFLKKAPFKSTVNCYTSYEAFVVIPWTLRKTRSNLEDCQELESSWNCRLRR